MTALTAETINDWADNRDGFVALTCKQKLLPVEGEGGVIFPPTYADIGYNVDTLSDGTKVATVDSVGSQANRMEPVFAREPFSAFVPQITIELHRNHDKGNDYIEQRSILDLAHRSADAVVYSCPKLAPIITRAYSALRHHGDAGPLCSLAPTSLLFGVWDSRGGSGEKRPRLVRSIIRAWNVEPLYAAAQFNSIWKALNEEQQAELEKEAKAKKIRLSEKGFADAPATFRKISQAAARQISEFRDGFPNPERRVLGGVATNGEIVRDITVNLVALRNIYGQLLRRHRRFDATCLRWHSLLRQLILNYSCAKAAIYDLSTKLIAGLLCRGEASYNLLSYRQQKNCCLNTQKWRLRHSGGYGRPNYHMHST